MPTEYSARMMILSFQAVGNLTVQKRTDIGKVFDAHPALRPGRVGEDPPRTVVGESMVPHLTEPELPLDLIGAGKRREEDATWFIDLHPEWSVGGEVGRERVYRPLSRLSMSIGPERVRAGGGPDGLATFFREMGDALGAAYGWSSPEQVYAKLDAWYPHDKARPDVLMGLGSVYWLQYFGPAFVDRLPGLRGLPGAFLTARGAVVHRATEPPEETLSLSGGPLDGAWRDPLVAVLTADAFRLDRRDNPALPGIEDHAARDPDSRPAPPDLLERLRREAQERSERRSREFTRARVRRVRLEARRSVAAPTRPAEEWSTNLDSSDVPKAWRTLRACLRPDVTGPYAGALGREIANAPHGEADEVVLGSPYGAFVLSWWVDDEESLVLSVLGPQAVIRRVDAALD